MSEGGATVSAEDPRHGVTGGSLAVVLLHRTLDLCDASGVSSIPPGAGAARRAALTVTSEMSARMLVELLLPEVFWQSTQWQAIFRGMHEG